jgi:hypothetical protein
MHTKLIVHHSRRLYCIVIHNHYHKPQNHVYLNPSITGRIDLKTCQVAPTSHQPNLVTLPIYLTYSIYLKNSIKNSYTRTTSSQASNLQPSPQMLNAVEAKNLQSPPQRLNAATTDLVVSPLYHAPKNLTKDNPTTTSHI